jgi:predicted protein tyrosine phosphatase
MWIENIGVIQAVEGCFPDPGENSALIQILDPGMSFPRIPHEFKILKQFGFSDVESDQDIAWDYRITDREVQEIADTLLIAKKGDMNVIVHCVAGLCRSGAVVEVGLMLGFDGGTSRRLPNTYVKRLLMKKLGLAPTELEYHGIFQ